MAKFCRYCGNPISDNARFCKTCGKSLAKASAQTQKQPTAQPVSQPQNQPVAQNVANPQMHPQIQQSVQPQKLPASQPVVQPLPQIQQSAAQPAAQPQIQQPVQIQNQPQIQQTVQPAEQPVTLQPAHKSILPNIQQSVQPSVQPQVQTQVQQAANNPMVQKAVQLSGVIDAPAGKGMFSYEMDSINMTGGMSQNIMAPVRTVMSFFPRLIYGLKNIGKNPLSLIGMIVLPLIWIVLLILRRTGNDDNIFVKILSWLSYGGDTGDRTLAGVTGSAIGRGTVALAYSSLLTGGIGRLRSGIKSLFSKQSGQASASGKGLAAAWLLTGAGTGLILNRFIAGVPSWSGVMAVIATVFVSLQACGNSSGYLYSIARSLTSRVSASSGAKTEDKNSIRMLLMGFIAGFACMIPYSAGNSIITLITEGMGVGVLSWLPLIIGIILLIVGMILVLTGKNRKNQQVVQQ